MPAFALSASGEVPAHRQPYHWDSAIGDCNGQRRQHHRLNGLLDSTELGVGRAQGLDTSSGC